MLKECLLFRLIDLTGFVQKCDLSRVGLVPVLIYLTFEGLTFDNNSIDQ